MLRNRDLDNREDGVLYVDEYVSVRASCITYLQSRTQDVYLHYPVLETPLVQRDLRRRATSNLKQPSYYGNKKVYIEVVYDMQKQYSPSTDPNTRLLPLHAWNAKRMKMRRMWGWYLPYVDNQHEVSSCLKVILSIDLSLQSVSRCATVHDSSYYEIISVYGCLDNVCEILGQAVSILSSFYIQSLRKSAYDLGSVPSDRLNTIFIYSSIEESVYCIGPVQLLIEQHQSVHSLSSDSATMLTVWLLCHPSISDSVFSVLQKLAVNL